MKVFISWSGERSNQVAELFKTWLKCVIQNSEPWVSSEDIENGSWWFNEIGNQLADTSIGVICLTKENKNKPWILFEAGALTKGLSTNRVTPLLIDLLSTDLTPPLSQLNATSPTRKGMHALVRTINSSLKDGALPFDVLERVFDTYWPQFEDGFKAILTETKEAPDVEVRDNGDILREVLSTVRGLDKRIRDVEQGNRQLRKAGITIPTRNASFDIDELSLTMLSTQIANEIAKSKSRDNLQTLAFDTAYTFGANKGFKDDNQIVDLANLLIEEATRRLDKITRAI